MTLIDLNFTQITAIDHFGRTIIDFRLIVFRDAFHQIHSMRTNLILTAIIVQWKPKTIF